ncbi:MULTISPECIES: helix-turn-helix domain-containing protein [Micromonospora]|uniref:helix-turn-helix domain-containing protein n=1 Tax=Micromonospora TaxID=1873 RepID=UPI00207D5411|nr:helix-turn-helix domain-containing protein [Micromonospora sp. CPM1]MCO1616740.1 helix-turn-helix domain-containing protein [Micromonospora sp. CPM1]
MRPTEPVRSGSPAWDIAVPQRPGRLAGVTMAGFSDRADAPVEVEVVPHPAFMVIFDLGDQPLVVDDGAGRQQRGCVTAGLASPPGAQGRGQAGSFACLQVRLSPVIAHAVLGAASELSGTVTALGDLWGRDAARIQERLRAARSWDDRFAMAEVALARRQDVGRAVDAEVAHCWRRMVAGGGQVRVERLAAEVGWSRKRLWARFRSQIGLTPKRAAQLIRFDRAAHRLAAGHSAAAAAADSGYADQSHLHRDVMTFTGATPTTVANAPFLAVDDVAWPARP